MNDSTERVLTMLREAGDFGVSTGAFATGYCPRASARICELRHKHGFEIESRRLTSSSFLYVLKAEPSGLDGVSLQCAVESSGNQRAFDPDQDPPAPPASARSLPPDAGLTLFELPAPGESPDADRYRDSDQRDAA